MEDYKNIGKKMYRMDHPREVRRYLVFLGRTVWHHRRMRQLAAFFRANAFRRELADIYPFVYEQPQRAFFYHRSTFAERAELLEQHFSFLETHMREDVILDIYRGNDRLLWEDELEGEPLRLVLYYIPGQRKEGLLSVTLRLGERPLYQMIFWIQQDGGEWCLYIGAMQGPRGADGRDVIKRITKKCHAYRTKNLILHATQDVARALGLRHIYAVTNEGYYANNHVRTNRKLKTNFGDFWAESGGIPASDPRFYELPLTEHRKTMEEIPTRKRANYRKRYALLDEIDAAIAAHMKALMREAPAGGAAPADEA